MGYEISMALLLHIIRSGVYFSYMQVTCYNVFAINRKNNNNKDYYCYQQTGKIRDQEVGQGNKQ